jgi:hypothetical protein
MVWRAGEVAFEKLFEKRFDASAEEQGEEGQAAGHDENQPITEAAERGRAQRKSRWPRRW